MNSRGQPTRVVLQFGVGRGTNKPHHKNCTVTKYPPGGGCFEYDDDPSDSGGTDLGKSFRLAGS